MHNSSLYRAKNLVGHTHVELYHGWERIGAALSRGPSRVENSNACQFFPNQRILT